MCLPFLASKIDHILHPPRAPGSYSVQSEKRPQFSVLVTDNAGISDFKRAHPKTVIKQWLGDDQAQVVLAPD